MAPSASCLYTVLCDWVRSSIMLVPLYISLFFNYERFDMRFSFSFSLPKTILINLHLPWVILLSLSHCLRVAFVCVSFSRCSYICIVASFRCFFGVSFRCFWCFFQVFSVFLSGVSLSISGVFLSMNYDILTTNGSPFRLIKVLYLRWSKCLFYFRNAVARCIGNINRDNLCIGFIVLIYEDFGFVCLLF